MHLDPDNQVVRLCVAAMQAEAENNFAEARALVEQAWAARQSDLDACIAAHYCARHQDTFERILHWNETALRYAEAVSRTALDDGTTEGKGAINAFYPSLYLNLGKSHEDLGDPNTARHYYQLAQEHLQLLAGEYGEVVCRGVAAGLQRTALIE